ncbi:hypothetical protein [Roseococcus sp.]|uniref:hypothetical protein n=1 Tax=Roseococcus sp. TaxID=2109646 RepID=UPI003BA96A28
MIIPIATPAAQICRRNGPVLRPGAWRPLSFRVKHCKMRLRLGQSMLRPDHAREVIRAGGSGETTMDGCLADALLDAAGVRTVVARCQAAGATF